jgi:hypothetical protein
MKKENIKTSNKDMTTRCGLKSCLFYFLEVEYLRRKRYCTVTGEKKDI